MGDGTTDHYGNPVYKFQVIESDIKNGKLILELEGRKIPKHVIELFEKIDEGWCEVVITGTHVDEKDL